MSRVTRNRKFGFLARSETPGGRRVIRNRRKKGRIRICL